MRRCIFCRHSLNRVSASTVRGPDAGGSVFERAYFRCAACRRLYETGSKERWVSAEAAPDEPALVARRDHRGNDRDSYRRLKREVEKARPPAVPARWEVTEWWRLVNDDGSSIRVIRDEEWC